MPKKSKRKAVEMGEGGATEEEERQTKKQRIGPQIAEERVKQKRTVFVGNLPPSCTKKVTAAPVLVVISSDHNLID